MESLKIAWGVLWRSPFWIGMIVLNLILGLIGLPLLAVADYTGEQWSWAWVQTIYGNNEDGIDGLLVPGKNPNWYETTRTWGARKRIWVWSAWRNSVNNLRYTGLGASPPFTVPLPGTTVLQTKGIKFWFQWQITQKDPWWVLWLGWKPQAGPIPAGFKATITKLAKVGA